MRRHARVLFLFLALLLGTACQAGPKPTAQPASSGTAPLPTVVTAVAGAEATPPTLLATAEPVFTSPFASPFMSPLSPLDTPSPTATVVLDPLACKPSDGNSGAVYGRALLSDGRPFGQATLYLGKWEGKDSQYPAIMLDTGNSPQAIADDQGRYCFPKVEPGTYGLVIWEAVQSYLVGDPKTGFTLEVQVNKGETTVLPDAIRP